MPSWSESICRRMWTPGADRRRERGRSARVAKAGNLAIRQSGNWEHLIAKLPSCLIARIGAVAVGWFRIEEDDMARLEMRGFQRQVLGKLREYEGHLKRLEGQLMILRGRAERATGEAQVKLGQMLADVERDAEGVRAAGRAALEGLERAVSAGQAFLEQMKGRLAEVEALAPTVVSKGREVVRRATIEAKALRHGVKVGLRVARRASKRAKAGKP